MSARLLLVALLSLTAAPAVAPAQGDGVPLTIGRGFTMHSRILGEDRVIQVALPLGYEEETRQYPVVYVLDGPNHIVHTLGTTWALAGNGRMEPMIVVAIGNTPGNRTRDLTTLPSDSAEAARYGETGGAERFLRFLERELKPWLGVRYRMAPYEVLIGHSLGGLFAIHVLNTRPAAFDGYIAISPSLWWDNGRFVDSLASLAERHPDLEASLYMTLANEGGAMESNVNRFAAMLEEGAPAGLRWRYTPMPTETHGTIPPRSTYDGLEWMFEPLRGGNVVERLVREGPSALPAVVEHFKAHGERFGTDPLPPEEPVNRAAYRLVEGGRIDDGIAVFRQVIAWYPRSANAHDSLGDGLAAACRVDEAREAYTTAIRMMEEYRNAAGVAAYRASLAELEGKVKAGGCGAAEQ